jgi:hypothetical protein
LCMHSQNIRIPFSECRIAVEERQQKRDIIQMLVSIYGSKELFINEYKKYMHFTFSLSLCLLSLSAPFSSDMLT